MSKLISSTSLHKFPRYSTQNLSDDAIRLVESLKNKNRSSFLSKIKFISVDLPQPFFPQRAITFNFFSRNKSYSPLSYKRIINSPFFFKTQPLTKGCNEKKLIFKTTIFFDKYPNQFHCLDIKIFFAIEHVLSFFRVVIK